MPAFICCVAVCVVLVFVLCVLCVLCVVAAVALVCARCGVTIERMYARTRTSRSSYAAPPTMPPMAIPAPILGATRPTAAPKTTCPSV